MAKHIPFTGSVLWTDGSSGSVGFETAEGLKRWFADLDVSHTQNIVIAQNPMRIGVTYDVEVHHDS